MEECTLSLTRLAERWGCSSKEIKNCIAQGMPHIFLGNGRYKFDVKKCERWNAIGYFESLPVKEQKKILKSRTQRDCAC
jgi:hypothetical protein